jgi:protein-tyrosine phosphatase
MCWTSTTTKALVAKFKVPPQRVLIVCKGNICRSPTVAVVLHEKIKACLLNIEIDAAGTEDYHVGSPPDKRSIRHAAKRGYDLSHRRARQVKPSDFESFDLILAADEANIDELQRICPAEHRAKLTLFLGTRELPDPYYGGAEGFETVLNLTEQRVEFLVNLWLKGN